VVVVAILGLGAAALVVASLDRPIPPTRAPDPLRPRPLGDTLVGPVVTTVDAGDSKNWVRFDFSRGSVVEDDDPMGWDLAFRRHRVIANAGPGLAGRGGILDLGPVQFSEVLQVPAHGYSPNRAGSDTLNPAIEEWYDYGFTTHLLTPKPRVYAVRTADQRYAKIEVLSYYCPGARPGCMTFRWSWAGDGERRVATTDPR
jgi:hypothetical protein